MPALLTTTSILPKASSAACTMRLADSHSATLSVLATAMPPLRLDLVDHLLRRARRRLPSPFTEVPMSLTTHLRAGGRHGEREIAADAAARRP